MNDIVRLLAGVALALTVISPAWAGNLPDPASGCQLTVPDDWTAANGAAGPTYSISSTSTDKHESVSLVIVPTEETSLDENSEYVKGFENFCEQHGVSIASRQHQTLNGMDFFVIRLAKLANASTTIRSTIWLTLVNKQVYQISLRAMNADPDKSAELTAAIQSFALIKK